MVDKQLQSSQEPLSVSPVQLSTMAGYQRFGDYLSIKRKQFGLFQREMAEHLSLTESMYGFLERGRRAPQVEELVPMFAALVQLQSDKRLPPTQVIEAETFFRLAKAVIENKAKKRPDLSQQRWNEIEQQLINLVDLRQRNQVYLVSGDIDASSNSVLEPPDSRRRKALNNVLKTDLSHLIEREAWVQHMLTYPNRVPNIKVSVTQASMGAGKSCALALLTQRLAERDDLFLIPYQFKHGETMTADDHLDEFLATLYADLTMRVTDETKQHPLTERIDQILAAIRAHDQKVILLLDDAQEMFPSASEWSVSWHQFFESFITEPHGATIYMMTRGWPGWDERKRSFLEEDDLPDLSVEAGTQLWKRQGFDDVDDNLLRKVCERSGQNPQAIEMLAFQHKRRGFSIDWRGTSHSTGENPHTASLKKLLESDTLFSGNLDETSRGMLQQVFSNRLSGEDLRLLECLALAPLGIPFDLVVEQFDYAAQSYEKLVKASFADLSKAVTGRAAVVPLVREAVFQSLTAQDKDDVEQLVTTIYAHWLKDVQDFKDDTEKAALIAEMIVKYLRQQQLLKAAELFLSYGWLCALFGHISRIQRVFDEITSQNRAKDLGDAYEAGRLFFLYHLPAIVGIKVDPRARDTDFRQIYTLVTEDRIVLNSHAEVYLANTLMQRMVHEKRYQDAYDLLQGTMNHITKAGKADPEARASFLHNEANLLGRWSSYVTEMKRPDEALRLQKECVKVLVEVVQTWRACLKSSLPIQERYYHFKLARALNDLAYYSRVLGYLNDAEQAIIECLELKQEKKTTLPGSLAVSLGEYAQILMAKGQYQKAEEKNGQAIQHIEQIIQSGNSSAYADKGMLLVERATIYEMQGRLNEAKQLLLEARSLLNEDRDEFRFEAEQHLTRIQVMEESSARYQMDSRWYARYLPLARYDDLRWLSQAGPFTSEEQRTWDRLYPRRNEEKIWYQMAEIVQQSKEREFEQSTVEGRLPHILYPAIDIDDIRSRMHGFIELKEMIEREEANVVVRRLYTKKIEEHLITLRLVEATYKQDIATLRACYEALYGEITKTEMTIALREFFKMLRRAQNHPQARELVEQILQQLKQWHLFAEDFITSEDEAVKRVASKQLQQWRRTPVSSHTVQHLYEEALKTYGLAEWQIILSPERDGISLDLDMCHLYLPTNNRFTALSVAELLTEEIETHILRSVAGKRSKLALLSSGTYGYLSAEEGLAALAIQEMMDAQGLGQKSNSWTTTLSPGMAAGVLTPPQSFGSLYDLFAKAFLANHLQSGRYETLREAEAAARYDALVRISRTFRGIPDLEAKGVGNLKDRVYLQGYREVSDTLTKVPKERLYVGSISVRDIEDMEELHILQPAVANRHLAHDPQLLEKIIALEKR